MSTLTLVRHAQARAFERDSDRLTPLGEQQAALLGEWWRARGVAFTEVYCGTLERQRRTAELAGAGEPQSLPEWNEYDAPGILRELAPRLAAANVEFAHLAESFERHRQSPEANRHFQRMFEELMTRWRNDEIGVPEVESFAAFHARVNGALRAIVENDAPGRRVLVITSGGPIGAAVQSALSAPAAAAIELNWRVRNCSITEFLFSKRRVSLDSFNAIPHLPDPTLVTWR